MKILLWLLALLFTLPLFLGLVTQAHATSGCCSWHGGESYCDYSTGRWVCADGSYSPTCTCGGAYQAPVYVPPPSCPLNSYYDSLSSTCKCLSGFISNGSYCISSLQYCWNTYGYNATYDYGTQKCECSYGYVWDNTGSKCISRDESCHNQLGIMSFYDSIYNTCDCMAGYSIQMGQCLPTPRKIYVPAVVTDMPTTKPTPYVYPTAVPTNAPSPTQSPSPTPFQIIAGSKSDNGITGWIFFGTIALFIWYLIRKIIKWFHIKIS